MKHLSLLLTGMLMIQRASGLTVSIDYSLDSSGFFSTNLTARAALEQAAADVSSAITTQLGALSPSSLSFTGTNGSTTATVDWGLSFTNPTTGAAHSFTNFTSAAGEFKVFAGARALAGSTLGLGGSLGGGFSFGGSGFESEWSGAVAAVQTASNSVMTRGGGPVIGRFVAAATFGASSPSYSLSYGAVGGVLTFDNDADNNGSADADLSGYWHFNHTTTVGAGLNDFYSVALHEIVHSLGFGGSISWDEARDGTTWLGAEGIAEKGTGLNLVDAGSLAHVASGVGSKTLDGTTQEAVMGPSLTTGTRKFLTELDLAMLEDIGYEVAAVPEPATSVLFAGVGALGLGLMRRRRRG